MNGLTNVNIELTSRCNKDCWMCGRRKVDRESPELADYGDMDFSLVGKIAKQLPSNITVQLHNNGEPLLYPRFGTAISLFRTQITNIVTNGKLLLEKQDEIIGNLDTMAISVFQDDPEADEQYKIIKEFLKIKNLDKPLTILRVNGEVDSTRYMEFGLPMAYRTLHDPMGSFNYEHPPTIPEVGICLDLLHHLAIDRYGCVSICVRFDPKREGVIGNIYNQTLSEIWAGDNRNLRIIPHKWGHREDVPLCSTCHFWGIPTQ